MDRSYPGGKQNWERFIGATHKVKQRAGTCCIAAIASLENLQKTKADRGTKANAIGAFLSRVQELDAPTELDEKLWVTIIDIVTVHPDGRMTFKFHGSTEIDV